MGWDRKRGRSHTLRGVGIVTTAVLAFVGCTSDPEPERATVTPSAAYTAIIRWEVDRSEPILDDDGNVEESVIYVAAGSGGTVDVTVQADVVAAFDDADGDTEVVVRFTDDALDARDEELENQPIKDTGVMLVIDEFEPGQTTVEARVLRYRSIDDVGAWILEVTADDDGATVTSAAPASE